jgi:hypothetical protein
MAVYQASTAPGIFELGEELRQNTSQKSLFVENGLLTNTRAGGSLDTKSGV